jgi:hypothetical protein
MSSSLNSLVILLQIKIMYYKASILSTLSLFELIRKFEAIPNYFAFALFAFAFVLSTWILQLVLTKTFIALITLVSILLLTFAYTAVTSFVVSAYTFSVKTKALFKSRLFNLYALATRLYKRFSTVPGM